LADLKLKIALAVSLCPLDLFCPSAGTGGCRAAGLPGCRPCTSDRPKTDLSVSAKNKYSAQGRKHQKNVNLLMENQLFS
jgi:hypothetical protein